MGLGPLARTQDLIVEELGDELLVYNDADQRAHCLSPSAARVWRRCDGRTEADALASELDLDAVEVDRALAELENCNLLEATPQLAESGDGVIGTTRRELSVKLVKAGGAIAAAPLIVSIAAPTPAAALSPIPGCEALLGCLSDCGNVGHGCLGTGCCCCQFAGVRCPPNGPGLRCSDGVLYAVESSVKFCAPNQGGKTGDCNKNGGVCDTFAPTGCACLGHTTCGPNGNLPCLIPCPTQSAKPDRSARSARSTSTNPSSSSSGSPSTQPSTPPTFNDPGTPAPTTGPAAGGTTTTPAAPTTTAPSTTPTVPGT